MEMIPPGGNDERDVRVVGRIKSLLDALSARDSCSLKEVSAESGLAISTTSRLLDSLENHGFVERNRETKRYQLGQTMFRLVTKSKPRKSLTATIHPVLEWLTEETGEDTGLAELHGTHAVIIDRVEGRNPLKIIDVIAQPEPLNCGAFRKVLLAFQADSWIDAYIRTLAFKKYTPRTIVSAAGLWREIARIRKLGYATSYGERLRDAGGIAAPIYESNGRIKACIHIVLPAMRMTPGATKQYISAVVRAAQESTALLDGPSAAECASMAPKSRPAKTGKAGTRGGPASDPRKS